MKKLNEDFAVRNKILFGKKNDDDWMGGTKHFENMSVNTLAKLLENNFIDPDDTQNSSPTVEEFFEFMKQYPKMKAHGYAVSHERPDYRISIEGLSLEGKYTKKMLLDFVHFARQSDEFTADENGLYCWWD
jgi:hypothetical protein